MTRILRGYTLVEMLVLISVTGLLMSLAAICMQRSVQAHKSALVAILYEKQLNDLYFRLKTDLAQALSVNQSGGNQELEIIRRFEEDSQTIKYLTRESRVSRIVYWPNKVEHSAHDWSVSVRLLGLEIDNTGSVPLALVRIRWKPTLGSESPEELTWRLRIGQESQ